MKPVFPSISGGFPWLTGVNVSFCSRVTKKINNSTLARGSPRHDLLPKTFKRPDYIAVISNNLLAFYLCKI